MIVFAHKRWFHFAWPVPKMTIFSIESVKRIIFLYLVMIKQILTIQQIIVSLTTTDWIIATTQKLPTHTKKKLHRKFTFKWLCSVFLIRIHTVFFYFYSWVTFGFWYLLLFMHWILCTPTPWHTFQSRIRTIKTKNNVKEWNVFINTCKKAIRKWR